MCAIIVLRLQERRNMDRLKAIEYARNELSNKSLYWSKQRIDFMNTCLDALINSQQTTQKLPVAICQIIYVLVPFDKPTKILTKIIEGYVVINDEVYFETETFSHPLSHVGKIVFTSEIDAYKELTKRKGEN